MGVAAWGCCESLLTRGASHHRHTAPLLQTLAGPSCFQADRSPSQLSGQLTFADVLLLDFSARAYPRLFGAKSWERRRGEVKRKRLPIDGPWPEIRFQLGIECHSHACTLRVCLLDQGKRKGGKMNELDAMICQTLGFRDPRASIK